MSMWLLKINTRSAVGCWQGHVISLAALELAATAMHCKRM